MERLGGQLRPYTEECLGRCKKICLSRQELVLIESYYGTDPAEKIARRKEIANEMSLTENALRIQAFRVRRKLYECIQRCQQSVGNGSSVPSLYNVRDEGA